MKTELYIDRTKNRNNLIKSGYRHAGKTIVTDYSLITIGNADKEKIKEKIRRLIMGMNKEILSKKYTKEAKERIIAQIMEYLEEEKEKYPQMLHEQLREYCQVQIEEILGFGAIQPYINDPEVSDIMVNGPGKGNVFIERNGILYCVDEHYEDSQQIMNVIEMIVGPVGRVIDESNPMVDARLSDGSRFNAIIPPLALNGPCFSIRKFHQNVSLEDMVEKYGTLTWELVEILKAFVVARLNILASGGTGSGKTTLLNTISEFIPDDERIITIEDAAELKINKTNLLRWETRKSNAEGRGEVVIRELVRNALRARPDRIIVGEVRGEEALDMLQAMNTGHSGSLTTGHANSSADMLSRLETMVLMAGMDLPSRAIREQISSALDVIVHTKRLKDGRRRIENISFVEGMDDEDIVLTDFMVYDINKDELVPTKKKSRVLDKLKDMDFTRFDINLPEWFIEEMQK